MKGFLLIIQPFSLNMADKDKLDLVHRDAIHAERVRKEQRHQKLHTEFSINPHRKCKQANLPSCSVSRPHMKNYDKNKNYHLLKSVSGQVFFSLQRAFDFHCD